MTATRWLAVVGLGVVSVALHTQRAESQVNIEALRSAATDTGFSGTVGLNLVLRTGNVELLQLDVDGRVDYTTSHSTTFLLGRGGIGLLGSDRFSNAGLIHLRHGRDLSHFVFPEAFAQWNYDEKRLLDFRALMGGGIRLGIVQRDDIGLWIGVGYMYEHERLDLPPAAVHPTTTSVHRASNYVVVRVAGGSQFVLASTSYIQPKLDELGDIRLLSDLDLAVTISRRLSLLVRVDMRYDSRPPDEIARLDTSLKNGLSLAF